MNNSRSKINNVYSFKKVIDDIVDANLANKGMVKYVSAKVVGINSNGTVNVYIPPDNSNIVNGLANKSGESLSPGDSVELCTKNGSLKNAWISVKHGIGTAGGASDNFPIGSIIAYGGTELPNNWLICDGSEVSRTAYKDLFDNIGTAYGEGDGSTTFNLPDMRGKVGIGLDSADTYFDTLGKSGGNKFHSHNYKIGWYGYFSAVANIDGQALATYDYQKSKWNYGGSSITNMVNSTSVNANLAQGANSITSVGRQASEAGTSDNNNLQPYSTVNYIIKASSGSAFINTKQAQVINNLTNTSITDALSANMGKTLNDRITSSTNAYWIGWSHTKVTLNGGRGHDWSNMTTYKSENISYSGKTITFGVSGLYYIKGYAHFNTTPVRSFITLEFSNAGDYCATTVRSNDTENMAGDPAYELNYMAYIKAGATMDITIYLQNTATLDGTSDWGVSSSGFCIYKIGNYIGE